MQNLAVLSFLIVLTAVPGPGKALEQRFTNGFLSVVLFTDPELLGLFTIQTGINHPIPSRNVLYPDKTSYFTLLDYSANPQEVWVPWAPEWNSALENLEGRNLQFMIDTSSNPSLLTSFGPLAYQINYTLPNFVVTQKVMIKGNAITNTFVQHTLTVKNTSGVTRLIGVRNMWDYMVDLVDDALFRTRVPDSDFTDQFQDFINPCFAWYEMTDDAVTPTFTVFGTAIGGNLEVPPVPPDEIRYASWETCNDRPWSFTNSGAEVDSAIVYYWGKHTPVPVSPGETLSFTQYVTTAPQMIVGTQVLGMAMELPEFAWNGSDFTVILSVSNSGTMPIEDISLVDTLPAGLELVSATGSPQVQGGVIVWEIDELDAGSKIDFEMIFRVPGDFPAGLVTNLASASYWKKQFCEELFPSVTRSGEVEIQVSLPCALSLTKQAPASWPTGGTFEYSLKVRNDGAGAAYDVVITDTLPSPLNFVSSEVAPEIFDRLLVWRKDLLEPGEEYTLDYAVNTPRYALDLDLVNRVQALGLERRGTGCSIGSGSATVFIYWNPQPALLGIEKEGPGTVGPQDEFDYTIRVANSGIGSAWDLVITDTLPAQFELQSASGSPEIAGAMLVWRLDYLAAGDARQFNVKMKVPGIYANLGIPNESQVTAWTESETGVVRVAEAAGATVFIHWDPKPARLEIEKSAPAMVAARDEFDYTILVRNEGIGSAWNLIITDTLPTQLTLVTASGSPETLGNLLVWDPGPLESGGELRFDVTVRAPLTYTDLTLTNSGLVTGLTESATGIVMAVEADAVETYVQWGARPALLEVSISAPAAVAPVQEFEYLLTVSNSGLGEVWDLVITDTLPAPLTLVSVSESPDTVGNLLVWRPGVLAPGAVFRAAIRARGPRSYADTLVSNWGLATGWTESETGIARAAAAAMTAVLLQKEALELRIFPNPFERRSAVRGTVKFQGILHGSILRIYTVRGLKVWEGSVNEGYTVEWDGTGESGQPVAPGTYIWIVESADIKQKGTLIVR